MNVKSEISRRSVLKTAFSTGLSVSVLPIMAAQPQNLPTPPNEKQTRMNEQPPALHPDLVKEFVTAAHGKVDVVKKMVEEHPSLLNATWDWGGGDFESALEAAGHMGDREIALFLIEKGLESISLRGHVGRIRRGQGTTQ